MNGAVLTGGKSRRFGSPKALFVVEGVPMAVRVGQALMSAGCSPVIAVGDVPGLATVWPAGSAGSAGSLDVYGPVVADRYPGEGPLGGILTALEVCSADVITVACDLPWLTSTEVQRLCAVAEAKFGEGVECVHGVHNSKMVPVLCWSVRALASITKAFGDGERSVRRVLSQLPTFSVELSAQDSIGVNYPSDLRD
jgi:molybdopterin-guanine dinucleotide biosynthesis protein A